MGPASSKGNNLSESSWASHVLGWQSCECLSRPPSNWNDRSGSLDDRQQGMAREMCLLASLRKFHWGMRFTGDEDVSMVFSQQSTVGQKGKSRSHFVRASLFVRCAVIILAAKTECINGGDSRLVSRAALWTTGNLKRVEPGDSALHVAPPSALCSLLPSFWNLPHCHSSSCWTVERSHLLVEMTIAPLGKSLHLSRPLQCLELSGQPCCSVLSTNDHYLCL